MTFNFNKCLPGMLCACSYVYAEKLHFFRHSVLSEYVCGKKPALVQEFFLHPNAWFASNFRSKFTTL